MGADFTVNIKEDDPIKAVKDYTNGVGPDVVIEATGRPSAIRQAIEMIKMNGTVVIFGVAQEKVDGFDSWEVYRKELDIFGVAGRGTTAIDRKIALNYLASGKLTVKPILTHVLPLEMTKRAFEIVDKRLEGVIRVVIGPPQNE